jgi:hypothetical protein
MTPEEDAMTKEFIDDNLAKGFIRPSKSPMATPFFFVHKKGTAKKRPCQDYHYLKNWTVKHAYSLPLISDVMDKVLSGDRISHFDMVRTSVSTLCKAHSQPLQSLYSLPARRDISSSLVYN